MLQIHDTNWKLSASLCSLWCPISRLSVKNLFQDWALKNAGTQINTTLTARWKLKYTDGDFYKNKWAEDLGCTGRAVPQVLQRLQSCGLLVTLQALCKAWVIDQLTLILQWLWNKGELIRHRSSWNSPQANNFSCESLQSLITQAAGFKAWDKFCQGAQPITNAVSLFILISSIKPSVMFFILIMRL